MKIDELRNKIDILDSQILELLNRRAEIVIEIGEEKAKEGMGFYAPQREEEIYERLNQENRGPFPTGAIKPVFREIISACLSLEHPMRVAYLGPRGTFTHLACMKKFGLSAEFLPMRSIGGIFSEVEKGNANYGVVPIENSTEGVVSHTLDMFVDAELNICGEIQLEVAHNLLSLSGDLKQVTKVYSHPHAIAQSKKWLEANLPHVPLLEVGSTAAAAELASQDPSAAAIASELAADFYNLKLICRRIEENPRNFTRFLVVGQKPVPPTGSDKTSIVVSIRDKVGALYRMLEPFAKNSINLTKIESRPSRQKAWEYIFYVDFEGNVEEERVQRALDAVKEECLFLKVLGSYPKGS